MERPLVSILTPSLNQGRFLADCITSVERQTYRPIEHVVCDGGSTDETLALLEHAPAHVHWQSEPDGGQADAVNKAFRASGGEIVGWINSDDALFAVDTVEAVVGHFSADPSVDVVVGHAALAREDGLLVRHYHSYRPRRRRLPRSSSPVSQPALFLRRRALREGEPLVRSELAATLDLELLLRLLDRGAGIAWLGRVLALDRDHPARKGRHLQDAFAYEAAALRHEYGYGVDPPLVERALAWQRRLRGVAAVASWRRYEPAAAWRVDALPRRLSRQLFTPHFKALERT